MSDGGVSCQGALAGGQGSCVLTFNTPGIKMLTASYPGNDFYAPSVSAAVQHLVRGPAEVPEADTLLLLSGGIGGLATWLGWQYRKVRTRK